MLIFVHLLQRNTKDYPEIISIRPTFNFGLRTHILIAKNQYTLILIQISFLVILCILV